MPRHLPALAASVLLLAACQMGGDGFRSKDSPFAPSIDASAEDIDGLIVGHRLMAAGEYELALKAYYRAASQHGATVDVYSAIGSANLHLGRLGQAESTLRDAIDLDDSFVPAWNNLGVVLMEKGEVAEAAQTFQTAFALDSGRTDAIRENLRRALAMRDNPDYAPEDNEEEFSLVRRGGGVYLLLTVK
ncbi:tetratricopeptide repeat protein [Albidovulum sediminicola]|uniref:Tetratricopeptide repeat protein n=1 Tax=Albidovulum sediminicola TaxID=2984331 RepID=A0ABT2Z351_9RHOB|nr:tetratricopeptide repeat protein [Defluviimonas sp. WL0075]MCV2865569.1 tetratricopeptide repeat protein [Defluviimonas sp. WL0075]